MRTTLANGTPVEIARPDGPEPARGLVVIPDIGGLRPLFDDLVARLAAENAWAVAAAEPFPGQEQMSLEQRMTAMASLDDDRQLADIVAAADLLGVEPVAVIGFCMGGMYTMKAASTGRFDRAAAFYGMIRVPDDWRGPGQRDALAMLLDSGAAERVLAIIGTADPYTPRRRRRRPRSGGSDGGPLRRRRARLRARRFAARPPSRTTRPTPGGG